MPGISMIRFQIYVGTEIAIGNNQLNHLRATVRLTNFISVKGKNVLLLMSLWYGKYYKETS